MTAARDRTVRPRRRGRPGCARGVHARTGRGPTRRTREPCRRRHRRGGDLARPARRDGHRRDRLPARAGTEVPVIVVGDALAEPMDAFGAGASDVVPPDAAADLVARAVRYAATLRKVEAGLRRLQAFDELTGLLNARGFDLLANHHFRLADRSKHPVLIVFLRVDEGGETPGEAAVADAATVISSAVRVSDVVARVGSGPSSCSSRAPSRVRSRSCWSGSSKPSRPTTPAPGTRSGPPCWSGRRRTTRSIRSRSRSSSPRPTAACGVPRTRRAPRARRTLENFAAAPGGPGLRAVGDRGRDARRRDLRSTGRRWIGVRARRHRGDRLPGVGGEVEPSDARTPQRCLRSGRPSRPPTASNLGSGAGVGRTYTNQYTSPGDHTKQAKVRRTGAVALATPRVSTRKATSDGDRASWPVIG